jgi:hypothetical protein
MSNNNVDCDEDYAYVMISETINEIMEYMKQTGMLQQPEHLPKSKPPSRHTDAEMFKGMTMLDDKLLPCFKLNLSQAMLELKKNPKCVPFQIYLERWKFFNNKHKKRNGHVEPPKVVIDERQLPSLSVTLAVAIDDIKRNPLCIPFEVYLKKWNELKTIQTYAKMTK